VARHAHIGLGPVPASHHIHAGRLWRCGGCCALHLHNPEAWGCVKSLLHAGCTPRL
jgi:hypothetical protein